MSDYHYLSIFAPDIAVSLITHIFKQFTDFIVKYFISKPLSNKKYFLLGRIQKIKIDFKSVKKNRVIWKLFKPSLYRYLLETVNLLTLNPIFTRKFKTEKFWILFFN